MAGEESAEAGEESAEAGEESAEAELDLDLEADDSREAEMERLDTASERLSADLRRTRRLKALLLSRYDSVSSAALSLGWTVYHPSDAQGADWHVCWSDNSVALERIMRMGRLQKINHFPGMLELARKSGTARNLNRMLYAVGPKEYGFFPRTFMLPADYTELKKEFMPGKATKMFIVKPSKGCQGRDIRITRR